MILAGKIKELEDTNASLKIKEQEYAEKIASLENQILQLKKVFFSGILP